MSRRSFWLPAAALAGAALALQADTPTKPARPAKPATVEPRPVDTSKTAPVKQGKFQIDATLKGVFESANMTEIALRLEAWLPNEGGKPLTLLSATAPATRVTKGETLVTLDTVALDRAIRDLEIEQQVADANIAQAE